MSETRTGSINPMIFNDEPDKKKLINPMVFDVPTKSVEEKIYIVLLASGDDDEMFDGRYKICHGRTQCFRYIESLCQAFGGDFDPFESKVITETKQTETETENTKYYLINYENSISVYSFCKSVEGFYGENGFNIDDYFKAPSTEDEEAEAESSDAAFKEQAVHRVYRNMLGGGNIQSLDSTELHILKDENDDSEGVNV